LQFCFIFVAAAQPWAGVLDSRRATDWSGAGAQIVDRTTQCGATIAAYTGSAATINNAISNCPAGQYVRLGAGKFTLSDGVMLGKDNVTLRGSGADQTILDINGNTASGCHIGEGRRFNICKGGGANIGVDSADNTANWTAGYAQGSTSITLSARTNLKVGSTIWLDQLDDSSDGYPAAGDVWIKNWGSGDSYVRSGRGLVEGHIVTGCGTTTSGADCTSNTVTITPPVQIPVFRSTKSPGAWWGNPSSVLVGAGLEDLTIDATGSNAIYMVNCTGCWVKGVRTIFQSTISSGQFRLNNFINVVDSSVVNNYFYGPQASGLVSIYGLATHVVSGLLFQNNIIHGSVNPFVINSSTYGSVFAYNVFDNVGVSPSYSQSSFILHGHASMNLFEGNNARNFSGDNIHTSHFFNTLFRNHFDGTSRNPSGTETRAGIALYAAQRFFNLIGNVIGASEWTSYTNSQSPPAQCTSCIYMFGWQGTNSNAMGTTGNDTNVLRTVMRWGNYDSANSATRFQASEVPSGIPNYSNAVPGTTNLAASWYLNVPARSNGGTGLSWWKNALGQTAPFPPVGPDVTGGSLPNSGGHAFKIPARVCFENTASDSAYSVSPAILKFSASRCYQNDPSGSLGSTLAPTNVTTLVR
jgi:hypothetical protein